MIRTSNAAPFGRRNRRTRRALNSTVGLLTDQQQESIANELQELLHKPRRQQDTVWALDILARVRRLFRNESAPPQSPYWQKFQAERPGIDLTNLCRTWQRLHRQLRRCEVQLLGENRTDLASDQLRLTLLHTLSSMLKLKRDELPRSECDS